MSTQLANPEYTYEYFQRDDVCRLCWNRSPAEPIHSKTDLLDKIADCLNIVVTTHLPHNACVECCTQIDKFYKFKKFCQSTDKRLQEIINNYLKTDNKEGMSKFKYKSEGTPTHSNIKHHDIDTLCVDNHNIQHHSVDNINIKNHGIGHFDINNHDIEHHGIDNLIIKNHDTDKREVKNDDITNYDIHKHGDENLNNEDHGIKYYDIDNENIKQFGIDNLINNHGIDNHNIEKCLDNGTKSLKDTKATSGTHDNDKHKWKYKPKRTPTYCNVCMIDYETIEKLKHHNVHNHGIDNGVFKCFGCDKTYKNRKARFCHEKSFCKGLKDGYKCTICDRFLPKRSVFEAHMRDHRENVPIELPDEMFQCQKCNKLFKSREDLNCHVEAEHETDKKNYVCESCGRVFTRRDYLNKHKLTHTGDKQHVCPHCDFRTIQRSSLIVHIRKHTGERPYRCSMCPQRCVSSSNLRAHLRRHMGVKVHECTICNKKFGYKVSLREHMTSHAPAHHACPHCSASYSRPRTLRRHLAGKHGQK